MQPRKWEHRWDSQKYVSLALSLLLVHQRDMRTIQMNCNISEFIRFNTLMPTFWNMYGAFYKSVNLCWFRSFFVCALCCDVISFRVAIPFVNIGAIFGLWTSRPTSIKRNRSSSSNGINSPKSRFSNKLHACIISNVRGSVQWQAPETEDEIFIRIELIYRGLNRTPKRRQAIPGHWVTKRLNLNLLSQCQSLTRSVFIYWMAQNKWTVP